MTAREAASELRKRPCLCGKDTTHFGPHREGCPRYIDRSASREIREALVDRRHNEREGEWISLKEFHRIDLFAMRLWSEWPDEKLATRSGLTMHEPFHRRVAYEIKVSRSDFRAEIRKPEKRAEAVAMTHQWFFATPPGLVKRDELPPECGLVEVTAGGEIKVVRHAPIRRPTRGLNMHDVSALLSAKHVGPSVYDLRRQASNAAAQLRGSTQRFDEANTLLALARTRLIREKGSLVVAGSEWIGPRAVVPGMSKRKGMPEEVRVGVTGVSIHDGYEKSPYQGRVYFKETPFDDPYCGYSMDAGDFLIAFRHEKEPERVPAPPHSDLWSRKPLRVVEGGGETSDDIVF